MAFLAEDGTGLAAANSLGTVAYADAYFAERGVVAWAGTNTAKEQALVRATDYIETRWGRRNKFMGAPQFDVQALSFPRLYINEDGVVPDGIKKAVSEYALRALTTVLLKDPPVDATGRLPSLLRSKVGPIETEKRFADGAAVELFRDMPAADLLLRPYIYGRGGTLRV